MKWRKPLKGYEYFDVEHVNGERGKVLKRNETLEAAHVNGKAGKVGSSMNITSTLIRLLYA